MDRFIFLLLAIYALFSTISIHVMDLTLSIGLLLAAYWRYRNPSPLECNTNILRFNGLFLLICIFSIFVAFKPILAVNKTWNIFFDMTPLFLSLMVIRSKSHINILLWALVAALTATSAFTIYQGLLGHTRAEGFLVGHPPQGLAGFLVLLIMYFTVLTAKNSAYLIPIARYLFLILTAAGTAFLFNGTRGAWLALLVTLISFSIIHLRSHRKAFIAIILAIFVMGTITAIAPQFDTLRNRISRLVTDNADSERLYKWQMATAVFEEHPILGVGIDNYISIPDFERYLPASALERQPSNAHNIFLHILAETGLLGLVAYLLMFGQILYHCWQQYRRDSANLLCLAAFYATVALLVYGQTEYITNDFAVMRLYWLLIGIAWQDAALRSQRRGTADELG